MSQPIRTSNEILAAMVEVMSTSNHADYKAAANLQLSAELQAMLSAEADATSRRNLYIATISLLVAIVALAIAGVQMLVAFRSTAKPTESEGAKGLYERQFKAAEQQLVDVARHTRATEDIFQRQQAILLRSEQQTTQVEVLTKRWEEQAKRYDAILSRWEQQPTPAPQPKTQ